MNNTRVMIAGGAGFIGSHLCDYYIAGGCEVLCVDNLSTGVLSNIEHLLISPRFRFINADIVSRANIPFGEPFDMILHFASPASPPDYFRLSIETMKVNSAGTENLLELAIKCGARFLFSSTSEVYGDPLVAVQDEAYWGNVNPIGPRAVYDEAKRYGEAIIMAYRRKFSADTRIIRIFNTYGPRMRLEDGRVVPNFIGQMFEGKPLTVYGDGCQTRSFCYVSDMVAGIAAMMEADYHMPVNLGNAAEFTIIELAGILQKVSGKKMKMEFLPALEDDPKRRRPDISLARKLLGWQPGVSLEEGIEKTIEYFKWYMDEKGKR